MSRFTKVRIAVKNGKGKDGMGIERDYSKFLRNGWIVHSIPQDARDYDKLEVHDEDAGEVWEYDFGKLKGNAVIPLCVKVYFGKSDYVECGYTMRKDGSYYYGECKCFRGGRGTNKAYEQSEFRKCHERTMKSEGARSLMFGWLLPDETKDAIEAELKEATSGKYRFEIVWDKI